MSQLKLKLKYGSKQTLLSLPEEAGSMMLSKDTQQIFFDFPQNGVTVRRSFAGIVYLTSQYDREELQQPQQQLYFVRSTYKFYYYFANEWYSLFESSIVSTTYNQMEQMTECNTDKLYLDTSTSSLYHGINISGAVIWIKLNAYDQISDYIGQINIRKFEDDEQKNLISTQSNNANLVLGNASSLVKIDGELVYNSNQINTAGGLVQLNEDGKVPEALLDLTSQNAYFQTKTFSVNDLTNYRVLFTFEELGIEQPTIVQLIDNNGLIRDDIIPIYWTNDGLVVNLQVISTVIDQNTGDFTLKYLIAEQYNNAPSGVAKIATKSFDPYGLPNNLQIFTKNELGVEAPTMVQLIDDEGLIRDDVIPVYWQNNNLYINFAPITQVLVESGHIWQIKYLVAGVTNPVAIATSAIVTKYFDPYGLTNNTKTFSYAQLNLTTSTIVQLFDQDNILRNDILPVYWSEDGLQLNFQPIASQITESGHLWHIKYMAQGTRVIAADKTAQSAVLTKQFDPYGLPNNLKTFTFASLNLTKPTIVQLVDNTGVIRDDLIPVYWNQNGLVINFSPVQSQITEAGHIWQIEYLAPGSNDQLDSGLFVTKAYADEKYATKQQMLQLQDSITQLLDYMLYGSQYSEYSQNSL